MSTHAVVVRLDDELYKRVSEVAKENDRPLSYIVRTAITDLLSAYDRTHSSGGKVDKATAI